MTWMNTRIMGLDDRKIRLDIAGWRKNRRKGDFLFAVVSGRYHDRHAGAVGDMVKAGLPLLGPRARSLRRHNQSVAVAPAELLDTLLDHPARLAAVNRHRAEPAQETPVRPLKGTVLHHDVGIQPDLDHRGAGKDTVPVGGMWPANHHRLGHIRKGVGQSPTEQLQESLAESARKSVAALWILRL